LWSGFDPDKQPGLAQQHGSVLELEDGSGSGSVGGSSRSASRASSLQNYPDCLLKWLWRNSQIAEPKQIGRRHGVHLHELDLISRDGRAWQELRCAGQRKPDGKWDWDQPETDASLSSDTSDKVSVCVDVRTATFESDRIPLGSLHHSGNRLSHVVRMGRLQFCHAVAKHWISGQPLEQLENDTEKSVIWPKHDCGTDQDRTRKCGAKELHPGKTRIVYCKDINRTGDHPDIQFTFLGYTFRPRKAVDKYGRVYVNFTPAVSRDALKAMRQTIRGWHLQLKSDKSLADLSATFAPILKGWQQYYGRFHGSALKPVWRNMNMFLTRWLMRKHKKLAGHKTRAAQVLRRLAQGCQLALAAAANIR
jgi:Group II intron, maturase-specific domain